RHGPVEFLLAVVPLLPRRLPSRQPAGELEQSPLRPPGLPGVAPLPLAVAPGDPPATQDEAIQFFVDVVHAIALFMGCMTQPKSARVSRVPWSPSQWA